MAVSMEYEEFKGCNNLRQDDLIILIMGPTGTGKSNFIDHLTGRAGKPGRRGGNGLRSYTSEVTAVRMKNHPKYKNRIILVDSPGFDNTQLSNQEVLETISLWLTDMCEANIFPHGIMYTHRITDNRSGEQDRNLKMFIELCRKQSAKNILFVTTMWDKIISTQEEEDLEDIRKKYWGSLLDCSTARFYNNSKSAWDTIDTILAQGDDTAKPMEHEDLEDPSKLDRDDLVIVLMGPTGTGKSNIIDNLTGQLGKRVGHSLKSCTTVVGAVRIKNHRKYGDRIVLVDTPGFDDTEKSDLEILRIISDWLVKLYEARVFLCGIMYLHRITDVRLSGSHRLNLDLLGELCGSDTAKKVVFVTTMWDELESTQLGVEREKYLKENDWLPLTGMGASIARSANTTTSAWEIVENILARPVEFVPLQLQVDMVDLKRPLVETKCARALLARAPSTDEQRKSFKKDGNFRGKSISNGTSKYEPVQKLKPDDIVIAFMGPTGSGKSNIIDNLTGAVGESKLAGSASASYTYTKRLNALRIKNHHIYGDQIVLLDTPGFGDTTRTDIEIFEMIIDWLVNAYKEKVTLAGIVYLHRITDNRMSGAYYQNLRMFDELCGEKAAANVVLVTTMWDKVEADVGEMREEDLTKNYWKKMI
ncbi:hypothetical protein GALMADRAFT_115026, partial [Galerina marginata CBS 339.88]